MAGLFGRSSADPRYARERVYSRSLPLASRGEARVGAGGG